MRLLLVLAGLASLAALTVACQPPPGGAIPTAALPGDLSSGAAQFPFRFLVSALFTFAVSAFNGPLR